MEALAQLFQDDVDARGSHGRHLLQAQRVAGVGPGVFVLIFVTSILGLLCLIASRTRHSAAVNGACGTVYGIVLLVLFVTPRGERSDKRRVEVIDFSILWLTLMALALLGGVATSLAGVAKFVVTVPVKARRLNEAEDVLQVR